MLHAVFYARFHPRRGPSIIHQFPLHAITSSNASETLLPIHFSNVSPYIIPPYELCNQPLSICVNGYRILGHPISVEDPKYDRNRFTFNICFVLDETEDSRPWQPLVKKTAAFLKSIEEQEGILHAEETLPGLKWADAIDYPAAGVGVLHALLQRIVEDLNEYGETCTRLDRTNVLNLRIFPTREAPTKVQAWDVPLLIRSLPDPEEWTWDLTLSRIQPHINGINYIQRIAAIADVEVRLVKRAVRELVYHERAILLDIFHFGAIYVPTMDLSTFVRSVEAQDECRFYIHLESSKNPLGKTTHHPSRPGSSNTAAAATTTDPLNPSESLDIPTRENVIALYTALSPRISVHDFVLAHQRDLASIDIRRFITFGVIKGFLRRVHKFALAIDPIVREDHGGGNSRSDSQSPIKLRPRPRDDRVARELDRAWKLAALSSGWATPPTATGETTSSTSGRGTPTQVGSLGRSTKSNEEARALEDERLRPYLNGKCSLDQIAVELGTSERKIVERLRSGRFDDVVLFCR